MSDDSITTSGPLVRVEPLTSSTEDGKPYQRSATVEAELGRILRLPPAEWLAEAKQLQNESLVYLIRSIVRRSDLIGNEELFGYLVQELNDRTVEIASRWTSGFDEITAEEIQWKVEERVISLLTAKTVSRNTEFLEMAFVQAVEGFAINLADKYRRSVGRHAVVDCELDDEGNEIKRPIELAADNRPNPEATLLQALEDARQPELIQKAYAAVEDPRHLDAAIRFWGHGQPVRAKDAEFDLERHFQVPARQIRYWLWSAMKAMRKAIGEKT